MQPIIIPIESEAQWLALKKEDISSTEISALFDCSPYEDNFTIYHRKKGTIESGFEENERVIWGRLLEAIVAEEFANRYGLKIRKINDYMRHGKISRMSASFDYEIIGFDHTSLPNELQLKFQDLGNAILEIKMVDSYEYKEKWIDREAPLHIEFQHQQQLEVSNIKWGVIAVLIGGNKLDYLIRNRNEKAGAAICKKIERFWHAFDNNIAPKPNFEKNAQTIIRLHQLINPEKSILNEPLNYRLNWICKRISKVKRGIMRFKDLESGYKAELFTMIGEHKKAISQDFEISTTIVDESEMILTQRGKYRRLTIKKIKQY
jgi:putative phage-type endonuclease